MAGFLPVSAGAPKAPGSSAAGLMDYSLLLHVVTFPSANSEGASEPFESTCSAKTFGR